MREVYGRLMDDYYSFGNAYLQIVKYEGGINLFHIDATKCRVSKDQEHVYIHSDWAKYGTSKEETVVVPTYPRFEKNTSIVHFKDYEPTFNYYGLPDFVGALEGWLQIDWELQTYNHSKFKNNFTPSAIVEINGDMGEQEAEKLVKDAQQKWTGKGNNSKILFLVKNGDTSPATILMFCSLHTFTRLLPFGICTTSFLLPGLKVNVSNCGFMKFDSQVLCGSGEVPRVA